MDYAKIMEIRRSIYNLGNSPKLSQEKILEIIEHAIKFCPSAFNSQSARTVVLLGDHHTKLWNLVLEVLKTLTPPGKFPATEQKINHSFKSGSGTILFYEDEDATKALQQKFPPYADNFPKWALQSNGMLEYIIWSALAEQGVGATLQHYNPIIDKKVAQEWNIPSNWKLLAQMPFGSIESPADPKDFQPIETRLKIFR